jgi:hypothetical protein
MHTPKSALHAQVCDLTWRRDGRDWRLFNGRRRMGHVVPDPNYPGMWRSRRADGQLSDMVNLSWAKSVALDAACREIAFERRAIYPKKPQQKKGVFQAPSSPVRQTLAGVLPS